jgi:glycosyltransferase involved in cell wall biosynthesis
MSEQLVKPIVSCIMPTAERRHFVPEAIRRFLAQDLPDRELIIVDDGGDPVADLVPPDPRIRYIRLGSRRTIGWKRNVACDQARAEIIVHWDDDDWMSPRRLSIQVSALMGSRADACGLACPLFYEPSSGRAWIYDYPRRARPWIAGGTLCYRRACWARRPFPNNSFGEDTHFVWVDPSPSLLALEDNRFFVGIFHPGNTDPKHVDQAPWRPISTDVVRSIMGEEAEMLVHLVRSGQRAAAR